MTKEQRFFNALKEIFIGAKVEGESGYINLMKIKSRYYESAVFPALQRDIEKALKPFPDFREELFDKLYTFFHRYFSKSGSIYFNYTPIHQNVYEKIYTDEKDVVLFWKTHMLYYVKTDRLFNSLEIESDGAKFFFDASKLEHKKANEKRDLIYEFKEVRKDKSISFLVYYSERGRQTKTDDILKQLKKSDITITQENLERAFRVFEKQSEVDYFINKNAKQFLREQFDLWMYQYLFSGQTEYAEKRIKQLQTLKEIAFNIIDFIAQFEDELVRIWNKPKFVLNSNYVITIDRIAEKNFPLVETILKHAGIATQIEEWKLLGIIDNKFKKTDVIATDLHGKSLSKQYRTLPIDTKYFKDLELVVLGLFDNLDQSLDGWLIKSENYQALNTILPKFRDQVQQIYIDPPFNKEKDANYLYSVKYKNSSWLSILESRVRLSRELLQDSGNIFLRCDYNGNMLARSMMDEIYDDGNFKNEIVVKRGKIQFGESSKYTVSTDSLYWYAKSDDYYFNKFKRARYAHEPKQSNMILRGERFPRERIFVDEKGKQRTLLSPPNTHFKFIQTKVNKMTEQGLIWLGRSRDGLESGFMELVNEKWTKTELVPSYKLNLDKAIDTNWTDISGYASTWGFDTENSELLLRRALETGSEETEIVCDFFLGSGTTIAVAHKLKRKWIGIELGEHIYSFSNEKEKKSGILIRMKEVLFGSGNHEPSGISRETKWKGGGFFKYYEMEQYEETLKKVKYDENTLFSSTKPYDNYIFLKDKKLLDVLEIDYKKNKVNVNLSTLYDHIDIAETLSNLKGKWIKRITKDEVVFDDGETINLNQLDYKLIKDLIWW